MLINVLVNTFDTGGSISSNLTREAVISSLLRSRHCFSSMVKW